MSVGFEIPPEQLPEDPKVLSGMLNALNDVTTGYDYSGTYRIWEEKGYSAEVISDFVAFAETTTEYVYDHGEDAVVNLTELYKHWDQSVFENDPDLTTEMIESFNDSFWNGSPERLVAVKNLAKKTLVIYGGIPPLDPAIIKL